MKTYYNNWRAEKRILDMPVRAKYFSLKLIIWKLFFPIIPAVYIWFDVKSSKQTGNCARKLQM